MKKITCLLLFLILIPSLCGCNSFEISGIGNYTETDCVFGLNYGLLPNDRGFLSTYPYESASYYYWRNEYGPVKAKTFLFLQYSEEFYLKAKSACQEYYTFSEESYLYGDLSFFSVSTNGGDSALDPKFLWLYSCDDATYTMTFLGYINHDEDAPELDLLTSDFEGFVVLEFGDYIPERE